MSGLLVSSFVDRRYHHGERCYWCGAHASQVRLRPSLIAATGARGLVCADSTVDCARRRERRLRHAA